MALKLNIPIPSKGLVVDRPAEFIDPRAISNCQNIEIARSLVQQRRGSSILGSGLGERILGMAELEFGINQYFVRVGPTDAETIDKSTMVWTSIANAPLTCSEEDQVYFAYPLISAVRYLVYTNGVDNIRKYNGTGNDADLGGSPPKCRYLLDFGGYLLLAYVIDGGTTYYTRVQWSDTGDPETWSGGNTGSVDLLEDSTEITGISRFGNYITIHKENCIYLGQLVDTSEVFRFTRKETGSGAISQGTIQNLPDGTQIFLARDGLRLFNGITSSLIVSPIIDELRDSMSPKWVKRATSILVKDLDEYWVGIPIGSQEEPETIYKYNYRTGEVYKDLRTGLMAFSFYRRTDDESWDSDSESWDSDTTRWDTITDLDLHRSVAIGFDDGNTYLRDSSVDDDVTAVDSIWDTKDFTIADIDQNQPIGRLVRWSSLDIWAKGNSADIYYSTDSGTTWTLIGSIGLDSDYPGDDAPDILYFDVISSKIRFRFRNNEAGESWTLKQYVIGNTIREVRK